MSRLRPVARNFVSIRSDIPKHLIQRCALKRPKIDYMTVPHVLYRTQRSERQQYRTLLLYAGHSDGHVEQHLWA